MSITIIPYKSIPQLQAAHPEAKNLTIAYQIPRGQTAEGILTALRKKNAQGQLFQVGNFVWKQAETLPKVQHA